MQDVRQPVGDERREVRSAVTAGPHLTGLAAGVLVILSGAGILVLEIVGMRLIAPYTGVTLQTSTAVISVALAAIASGAWLGGWLADRRDPGRLLTVVFLLSSATTALTVPVIRATGPHLAGGGTAGVLALAVVTLFVPAALLAVVSPLVVKLRLTDLGRSGSVVGRLSGLGTAGSIIASLGTGFVLIAAISSSVIVWSVAVVLALTGVTLAAQDAARRRRDGAPRRSARVAAGAGGLSLVLLLSVVVTRSGPVPCLRETAYQCASVVVDPDRPTGRTLVLNAQAHSYVDLEDPKYLKFSYTRMIAAVVDAHSPPSAAVDVLHLGGGGLTLPNYVAATRAGSHQQVVEIDAALLDEVRSAFPEPPLTSYLTGDARVAVAAAPPAAFDLVIGDAFGHLAVPWHLTTEEFLTEVKRTLRPGGAYVLNLIDGPGGALARAEAATLLRRFEHVVVVAPGPALRGFTAGNFVMLAGDGDLPLTRLRTALDAQGASEMEVGQGAAFAMSAAPLTDDHAPVDQLIGGL